MRMSVLRSAPLLLVPVLAVVSASCLDFEAPRPGSAAIAVRVSPENAVIDVGEEVALSAHVILESGEARDVSDSPATFWESSDEDILDIAPDGVATGNSAGEVLVSATVGDLRSPAERVRVNATPGPPTPTPTPVAVTHLVISELMYNSLDEPAGQYIEIHNPGASAVDMTGWTVNYDNGAGTPFTFGAFTLNAGAYVVLANNLSYFDGVRYPLVTNLFQYVMPNLINAGGWFVLHDAAATLVDEVAYGSGYMTTKPAGWCATNSPSAADGFPVSRKPVNVDTNTCVDFVANVGPSPGTATP